MADTEVHGRFHMAGSHVVSFDRTALPFGKAATWYMAPRQEDDEYASGVDDTGILLNDLKGFQVSEAIAERGRDYYMRNKVVYVSVDGTGGCAIVEGSSPYEVEFTYRGGEISGLICSCFCSGSCKHQVAVLQQLRELLELIEKHYADEYERAGYFAAVSKDALFDIVIGGRETGSFTL